MIRKRQIIAVLIISLLASLVLVGLRAVMVSLQAERTHHAYLAVLDAIEVYLRKTGGRWPRGWDDLSRVRPAREPAIYKWPDELPEIRRRVRVRFDLTASEVASMEEERFSAVEPLGPNYGPDPDGIERVKRAARRPPE